MQKKIRKEILEQKLSFSFSFLKVKKKKALKPSIPNIINKKYKNMPRIHPISRYNVDSMEVCLSVAHL